jgi:hypothetical protein
MSVFNVLNAAIYTTLSGGTALTNLLGGTLVYYQQAPDGKAPPYLIYNFQGGGYEAITPRDMWNGIYFVRGFSPNAATAGSIDAQAHALLHKKALSVAGWTNFWLVREQDMALVENLPNGKKLYMAGGMYRVRLSA